jgi:hypothetical protein
MSSFFATDALVLTLYGAVAYVRLGFVLRSALIKESGSEEERERETSDTHTHFVRKFAS